jgi:hypothetical protein
MLLVLFVYSVQPALDAGMIVSLPRRSWVDSWAWSGQCSRCSKLLEGERNHRLGQQLSLESVCVQELRPFDEGGTPPHPLSRLLPEILTLISTLRLTYPPLLTVL